MVPRYWSTVAHTIHALSSLWPFVLLLSAISSLFQSLSLSRFLTSAALTERSMPALCVCYRPASWNSSRVVERDVMMTWQHMIDADVLLPANSGFSKAAARYALGLVPSFSRSPDGVCNRRASHHITSHNKRGQQCYLMCAHTKCRLHYIG